MKSKHRYWKLCLISLAGLVGLTGCKELSCDFSYSPTTPAAGQVVTFSNMSVGADDYYWNFGDNGTSTTASPTHIFRKPGTYTVSLMIKRKTEKRTRTQTITVIDTIPSITCDSDIVYTYTPVTFSAQVYNPWKKNITYQWTLPNDTVVLEGRRLTSSSVVCYFTQANTNHQVKLHIQLGDESPYDLIYEFTPVHRESTSVIFASSHDTLQQFAYIIQNKRVFSIPTTSSSIEKKLLSQEQDTMYYYRDTITKAKVSKMIQKDIHGFQVDRLAGKIYAYGDAGLWVCSMIGSNLRSLPTNVPVQAIKVDTVNSYLYWANPEGLFVHHLLGSSDNQQPFIADTVTTQYHNISRISINPNLH